LVWLQSKLFRVNNVLFTVGLLFAFLASAANASIYHDGWIDLNKDGSKDIYEDPTQPAQKRAADLLKRMTLDEKIGQLWQCHMETNAIEQFAIELQRGEISSFLDGSKLVETPVMRNKLQHIAVEQSRLGIPLIFGHDVIHGFRTVFPIPLAQACAWEPDLFERTQTISAREAAAAGIDWTFAPMVDLARDPRWGRIAEGFGEDPWLGALYAAADVRGFQGTNVAAPDHVVACMKHYVGDGAPEGGRDYNTTEISEYTLRNFYLPQFKAGVDAGAWTVMSAFNCLSGVPASANPHTLTEILRDEWHFPGYVVSDWEAVNNLISHGVAADEAGAARLAITAGVDMEMVSSNYFDTLKQQVEQGNVQESVVDEAVRRILTVKFARGLFENPYVDEARCQTAFLRPDALALAREAAAKSCVLLKNENGALPLSKQLGKIALIGPFADDAEELVGCWYSRAHTNDIVSLAQGIRAKLPPDIQPIVALCPRLAGLARARLSPDVRLIVARGCSIIEPGSNKIRRHIGDFSSIAERPTGKNEIAEAVTVAKAADVVVMALGEPRDWIGEDASRSELGLSGRQMELFEAVAATGKPVIVILFNGRPLALPRVREKAAAILEAWFPGIQGGNGVANVLFGDTDPAGRLTATFPRSVGQVLLYYNHLNTGRPELGKYTDGPSRPLYPFGFGLTYTTFEYGKVELSAPVMKPGETLTACVQLKNTGSRAGTEVAQLYIRALAVPAGPRPVRELKGFQKVLLQPGELRDVTFTISGRELGYYDAKGRWFVEPGKFQLWITKDSASGEPVDFSLAQ
jgi:beta-glucosidase